MTFDDDFIRVEGGVYSVAALGLSWPPPEVLYLFVSPDRRGVSEVPENHADACEYQQVSRSQITDEDRAEMTHVARGADYRVVLTFPGGDR